MNDTIGRWSARGEASMINLENYIRDNYNPLNGVKRGVVIDLDRNPVDVVKNGKQYSLVEFIEECINDVLDLRMKEERE